MRPRQNLRDYHHNSHPPYQSMNHNPNLLQQQRQQSMMPPHPSSGTPPLLGPAAANAATRVIQPSLPAPDLISELIKLGFNPEDMAKQSNRPADLLRNLQAILGKREAADLLQKLPLNDLFMQPPSEFAIGAGSTSSGANSRDSVICGPSGIAGPSSGPASFNNNINNGNSNKQEQDIQYSSAHHQANHHPQFRIPATNSTTLHNSPQQQQQQQQQHKQSVLSLHQQQHQQDPTNRRMNEQQHIMSAASSSPYGNLNDMSGRTVPTSSTLDSHNNNLFNRRKPSPPVNPYSISSASSAPRASIPMDTLGTGSGSGHPGQLENNMYDNPAFQQHNLSSANQQQSLIRHQQLQKLLRSSASGPSKTNMSLPTSSMSTRNDLSQKTNISGIAQMQRQMNSPNTSSAISPPQQALSSVPKSLLNLAACTSKSPSVTNGASIGRGPRNLQPNHNNNAASNGGNNATTNNRITTPRQSGNGNSAFNNRVPNSVDPTNLLHQMISRSNQAKNSNNGSIRNNQNTNTLTSLLSDDQRTIRPSTGQPTQQIPSTSNKASTQPVYKRQPPSTSDTSAVQGEPKSKEAYLAYLQERAAKAGISIGEISQGPSNKNSLSQPIGKTAEVLTNSTRDHSGTNLHGRNNEARNDLSLLYPPIELATSSQRQVSLLAAGFDLSGGVDVITDEVRKIIQNECNIIYECKGCSNLFRSLANLVKHKRQFCDNSNIERANSELNKQFIINAASREMPNSSRTPTSMEQSSNRSILSGDPRDSSASDVQRADHLNASVSIGSQKYNLRGRRIDPAPELPNQVKSTRITRSHDRREQISSADALDRSTSSHQSNLSRLLQSQPKGRQPSTKESALMDALNMPNPPGNRRSVINNPRNSTVDEINEQLVKNSSLAKTLLNENAKSVSAGSPAMQLARAVAQQPRMGPKRKLLEDCIQKVKRDKLGNGEEDEQEDPRVTQIDDQTRRTFDHINQFRDPLAIDDSEPDSDALVMDLDEPVSTPKSRRKGPRDSRSEDDRMQESSQTGRLNTSSALLKALTRPVESKSNSVGNAKVESDKATVESASTTDTSSTKVRSTGIREGCADETPVSEYSESSQSGPGHDIEVVPPSPLFDKYTCEICETDLDDQASLLSHIMEEHKKENKIYPCLFCSFTFITLENVCRHIIDIHKKKKAQVVHLKEVVRSRSFISQDFRTCSDCPQTGEEKNEHEELKRVEMPEEGTAEKVEKRRSSSALSDSAATKQILEDTLALVSDATSPDAAHSSNSSHRLVEILARTRSSDKRMASLPEEGSEVTEKPAMINDDSEDPLCDSLMNNLNEHLAILESQEAEIEAEKQNSRRVIAKHDDKHNVDQISTKLEHEVASNVGSDIQDDEPVEAGVEVRNQQTTPSRGKHIVAGQPFDNEEALNSDQDDDGDDDDLDFVDQESQDVIPVDNSGYGEEMDEPEEAASDSSTYGPGQEDSDEGESLSPDYSESFDNEQQDDHHEAGEHQRGFGVRISGGISSKRVHKRRRSSRNDDDDVEDVDDVDDTISANEHRYKGEPDLSPLASDKSETQNFHDVALSREGSSHSSRPTSTTSTIEGGCKLKLKSSVLRDASGSSTGGQQGSPAVTSADGPGGGIKKLKIQLKAQPDEKSKVYRIVN